MRCTSPKSGTVTQATPPEPSASANGGGIWSIAVAATTSAAPPRSRRIETPSLTRMSSPAWREAVRRREARGLEHTRGPGPGLERDDRRPSGSWRPEPTRHRSRSRPAPAPAGPPRCLARRSTLPSPSERITSGPRLEHDERSVRGALDGGRRAQPLGDRAPRAVAHADADHGTGREQRYDERPVGVGDHRVRTAEVARDHPWWCPPGGIDLVQGVAEHARTRRRDGRSGRARCAFTPASPFAIVLQPPSRTAAPDLAGGRGGDEHARRSRRSPDRPDRAGPKAASEARGIHRRPRAERGHRGLPRPSARRSRQASPFAPRSGVAGMDARSASRAASAAIDDAGFSSAGAARARASSADASSRARRAPHPAESATASAAATAAVPRLTPGARADVSTPDAVTRRSEHR